MVKNQFYFCRDPAIVLTRVPINTITIKTNNKSNQIPFPSEGKGDDFSGVVSGGFMLGVGAGVGVGAGGGEMERVTVLSLLDSWLSVTELSWSTTALMSCEPPRAVQVKVWFSVALGSIKLTGAEVR